MKKITVATAQIQAFGLEQAAQALTAIEHMIQAAGDQAVDLLVLPECAYPAYMIQSEDTYRAADILSTDDLLIFLGRQARKKKLHIACGFVEDLGTHLHNSAVLVDAGGQIVGTYRKSFLWSADNDYFRPGDRVPVFETQLGRIGMVICADTRAPEIIAKQVTDRAELIAMPTCWVNVAHTAEAFENPQPEYLISARAREFGIPFACANKFGRETEKVGYCGRSLIADRDGYILQEAAGHEAALLVQEVILRDTDKTHFHDELWESLIHWTEPVLPAPRVTKPLTVAVWTGDTVDEGVFEWLHGEGASFLVTHALTQSNLPKELQNNVAIPAYCGALRAMAIGKVGCVNGDEIARFSRTRLMALGGMEVLCAFDAPDDLKLLRTRAVENRTFVMAVGHGTGAIISPAGDILGYSSMNSPDGLLAEINVAEAASKIVAPQTDIWEQRRVEAYI